MRSPSCPFDAEAGHHVQRPALESLTSASGGSSRFAARAEPPEDPSQLAWLVEQVAGQRKPAPAAAAVLRHLQAALGLRLVALSLDNDPLPGRLHHLAPAPLSPQELHHLRRWLREIGDDPPPNVHRFRLPHCSGALLMEPDRDDESPQDTSASVGRALSLLDLVVELDVARQEASVDPLTGLFNRRSFNRSLGRTIAEGNRYPAMGFCLVMLDLNHFKWFNDTYGHQAGDEFLQELAKVLGDAIRGADLACRWGGDEFLLLLPQTTSRQAEVLLKRIFEELSGFLDRYDQQGLSLGFSAGVSCFPEDGRDADTLVRRADDRLYEQKATLQSRIPTGP
ncbi:MAG TPA: GGDEF domain-containing protein [Actinomycetota bacterium]|nr:GGDEF domain-containing protein [Actinomycetota bacterium]